MSNKTSWIPHRLVPQTLLVLSLFSVFAESSYGDICDWRPTPGTLNLTLAMANPVLQVDADVPIGSVMLREEYVRNHTDLGTLTCYETPNAHIYEVIGLNLAAGYSNVYETGIEGVGLRIFNWGASGGTTNGGTLPSHDNSGYNTYSPRRFFGLELIRLGQRVGSGILPQFTVNMRTDAYPSSFQRHRWTTIGTVNVAPKASYSCNSVNPVDTVDMGEALASDLKAGRSPSKYFNVDVRCSGRDHPLIRTYFEGNSPGPGVLNTQVGSGRASGVALALKDPEEKPLEFGSGRKYQLKLIGEDAYGHHYRFTGSAQYIQTGAAITSGRADASLTYVLDYN